MTIIAAALALALALAVQPPVGEAAPATDEIVVTGLREGTLNLKRLQAATAAFRAGRDTFAPGSSLTFQLRPVGGGVEGMTLHLRDGDGGRDVPIAVDAAGRFTLPDPGPGQWVLLHNRGKAGIGVRALVLSPGASEADRPLGDLRLQCRVGWEAGKDRHSFIERGAFAAIGGCDSSRVHFLFGSPRLVATATVTDGGGAAPLMVPADGRSFHAPIGDRRLPNAARIRLTYRAAGPVSSAPGLR